MTTVNTDIDTVASEPEPLVLSTGLPVEIQRLKTRQTMRLMKILTRGAGAALSDLNFSGDEDNMTQLLGTVLFSIPEAEDETVEFIRSMLLPAGLIADPRTKAENEANAALLDRLDEEMDNPELDDLVTIFEKVVELERDHLTALGKRVAALLKVARPTPMSKKPRGSSSRRSSDSTPTASLEDSQPPTT